jgi:hypothetical protein
MILFAKVLFASAVSEEIRKSTLWLCKKNIIFNPLLKAHIRPSKVCCPRPHENQQQYPVMWLVLCWRVTYSLSKILSDGDFSWLLSWWCPRDISKDESAWLGTDLELFMKGFPITNQWVNQIKVTLINEGLGRLQTINLAFVKSEVRWMETDKLTLKEQWHTANTNHLI